jgi:hypothetical protein
MMVQLLLSCRALSSPTLCRFIPALSGRPHLCDEGAFQFTFGMLFTHFKKVEGVFIFHGKFRLCALAGRQRLIEIGLAK